MHSAAIKVLLLLLLVCTVLIDGEPTTSCLVTASEVQGRRIQTIEGLSAGKLHPVQQAFVEAGAMQCGYCVPGMILTTVSLLEEKARPTDEEIVEAMNGNICRCCGYVRILDAVRGAAGRAEAAGRAKEADR